MDNKEAGDKYERVHHEFILLFLRKHSQQAQEEVDVKIGCRLMLKEVTITKNP